MTHAALSVYSSLVGAQCLKGSGSNGGRVAGWTLCGTHPV